MNTNETDGTLDRLLELVGSCILALAFLALALFS